MIDITEYNTKKNLTNKILKSYEKIRNDNKNKFDIYKNKVYLENPHLKKIDDELKIIRKNISIAKLENKSNLNILELEKDNLLKEKQKYNVQNQIYNCNLCSDTGRIQNNFCECFKNKFIDEIYKLYDINKNDTFEVLKKDFNNKEGFYNKKNKNYQSVTYAISKLFMFCENFNIKNNNLYLCSDNYDNTKNFLCNCVANTILNKNKLYVIKIQSQHILEQLYENHLKINNFIDCDLLIITDFGNENVTNYSTSKLLYLLESRIAQNKHTIISSNQSDLNFSAKLNYTIDTYFEYICLN